MLVGGLWELYGGVLAQARGPDTLVFKLMKSELKGIEEQDWEFKVEPKMRDFGMDPSQNLLVVIEKPNGKYAVFPRHVCPHADYRREQWPLSGASSTTLHRPVARRGSKARYSVALNRGFRLFFRNTSLRRPPQRTVHRTHYGE